MSVQLPDAHDADEPAGLRVGTFREEMREMPTLQRWVIYVSLFCFTLLLLQCLLVMPVILVKYGWGYNAG
jgi:hypothetical protein